MADYWKKKLKELEESQKKKSSQNTTTKKTTTSSDYWEQKMTELEKEEKRKKEQEDIAPVKKTTTTVTAPTRGGSGGSVDDEKGKWYDGWIKKGNDDAGKAAKGTAADFGTDFGAGAFEWFEGAIDWLAGIAPYLATQPTGYINPKTQKILDQQREEASKDMDEFIKKDLIDSEAISKEIIAGTASTANMVNATKEGAILSPEELDAQQQASRQIYDDTMTYLNEDMEADSVLDEKADSLVQSAGNMTTTAAMTAAGIPWWLASGASAYGSEMESALQQGATHDEAHLSAVITAAAEVGTEKLAGISFGGKTLTDAGSEWLAKYVSNKVARTAIKFGFDAAGEGAEEVLSGYVSAVGQHMTYADEKELEELFTKEDAWDAFIGGAIMGGVSNAGEVGKAAVTGVDPVTGLNKSEQKVFDKAYENAIAEAEQGGKKLTAKEKGKLYDQVMEDLESGDIDIDTIEEVLGGDTYKTYKDTVDSEDAQIKELENQIKELEDAPNTVGNAKKYDALTAQLEDLKTNSQRDQLKSQLSDEVFGIAKDTRLVESYNEKSRRGEAFEADVTQYDEKQRAVIQSAIDSGILNNTNKTHKFVDFIARVAADKGVSFNFADNAKIKETGFAIDGATVNGYVTENGDITLNINSAKSLNSVVGHEVTHILEGTDLYNQLQETLFKYAEGKGEYQTRLDALTKLYEGKQGYETDFDTKVKAELTADLVGDYLFTDADFIHNLSTSNRNVFEKIYDEIKYMYKVATAGSQEARELEKVKKLFEDAYRGETKNTAKDGGGKLSLSGTNKDGVEVYETSQAIMDLTWDERKAKYLEVMKKEYRGRTAKFERNGHYYYAKFDQGSVRKPIYGDNRSSKAGVKALIKAGADGDAFNLVENSQYTGSKPNTKTHTNADYFDYFVKTVQIDGKVFDLMADVEKEYGESGGYVYTLALVENKKIKASPALGTPNNGPVKNAGNASGDMVAQKEGNVKRQYSLTDNTGKELSKGQQDYFKDSKMRDDDGNLMVMYHGSQDAGFHEFNGKFSDDGASFFFVDRNDVAASYSGTSETYEAKTIRTAEDMNKFLAEIGYDQYEAVERDGKFELLEDGEHIAYSDTAQGIYEEFCWYESVGEGDANYKVYLDLKNPLVVDAGGRNWNNVSREYSQEIADRYNALTAEEKAALTDLAEWGEYGIFKDEMLEARATAEQGGSGVFDEAYTQNLASAYEKLGGANANLYDAFSISSDNFSEESIKQFAVKQMNTRDYAKRAKEQGYDGVIFKNIVDNGGYSNGSEGASTVAIAFDSKQIKSTANENPTENADIRYSMSAKGKTHKSYGNYNVYGKDVALAPVQDTVQDVAPVAENAKIADIAPVKAPVQYDIDHSPASEADVTAMAEESFASVDDVDAPPETEAPYYGESQPNTAADPMADRDWQSVGDRKVKAFTYENPEAKPFFQMEANAMLGELMQTTKGERHYNDELYYATGGEQGWYGTKRFTSDEIAYLLDGGLSYAQIENGLNAIIEGNGAENNAASKRIEMMINDRLLNGYTDFMTGENVPPNQGYIEWVNGRQSEAEYAESAAAITDADAPMFDAPIAPVSTTAAQTAVAEDLTEDVAPTTGKAKQRKWVGTSTESEAVNREILPDDLDQNAIHYQPIPNKVTLGNANARLDSMGYDMALTYFNSQMAGKKITLDDIALGERLIQESIKRGDKKTAGELIQNVSILGTELGQKVQALSIIKKLTPEGQLKMLQKVVERGKAKGDKAYDGVEVNQDMVDNILGAYAEDGTYDQDKLNAAVEDAKQKLADQMKVGVMDKVNSWRYLSMLGNPKTHIRNLVSNVAMKGTVAVKNAIARTVEDIAPIKDRTKTWKRASDDVKAFAEKTTIEMKDVLQDGGKYSEDASIKEKRKIFKSKLLNWLADGNSDLLSKEDWAFSKPAFKNALQEYLTANGIKTEQDILLNPEIVEKARQYATEQSQIATFRQYSWLSNKINEIEQKNAATQIAVGAILPFKKTPINIAKTGLSYSPLGFAKTLTYDMAQVKKGNMEASTLIDHLAQNVTGTALTLIGYALARAGFISGGGDDDKEGKYDYQLGEQSYAVNIGGKSYSLSWLSPVAMPLFVGANAYETLVEKEEWNGDVVMQTLAETLDPLSEMSFLSGLDSVLSSYDSGIAKFAGIGEAMTQNYVTQFIPTLSSQVATVMDDTKRSTKASRDSGWRAGEETWNKIKFKLPVLRQTLEPSTDIWGNDIKQTENKAQLALETFIAPYAVRENTATAIDEEIKGLYRETGDTGLLPSVPYNYLNYKDEKYDMSAEDFTAYKKTYGKTAYDMLAGLFDTNTYRTADSATKAELVNKVYDYARDEANREYLKKQGVTYTNATEDKRPVYKENAIKGAIRYDVTPDEYTFMTEYPEKHSFFKENGITYETYKNADEDGKRAYTWAYENPAKYTMSKAVSDDFLTFYKYKSDLSEIRADKDEYGESISGSAKEKKLEYINNLDLDYGQRVIMFRSLYDGKADKDNYNQDIVDYLNGRDDISYDEMVTILEELDMTVDENGNISW